MSSTPSDSKRKRETIDLSDSDREDSASSSSSSSSKKPKRDSSNDVLIFHHSFDEDTVTKVIRVRDIESIGGIAYVKRVMQEKKDDDRTDDYDRFKEDGTIVNESEWSNMDDSWEGLMDLEQYLSHKAFADIDSHEVYEPEAEGRIVAFLMIGGGI